MSGKRGMVIRPLPEKMRVSVSFDEDTFVAMCDVARNKNVSFGEVVRAAVRRGLISAGKLPPKRGEG